MKKITGVINDLHPDTEPKKLAPGQVVKYQLLTGRQNPDPEARRKRPIIYPTSVQVPTKDRIYDKNKQEYVDIAVVESVDKDKNVIPKVKTILSTEHGIMSFTGGRIEDEEFYSFFEICNANASNPDRDPSEEPMFKRVDDVKDSKERSKKRSARLEALVYAQNLTEGEVKALACALGWNEKDPVSVLQDRLEEYAEKSPEEFTKLVNSKDTEVKTTIKRALDSGRISYDTKQHKITLSSNGQTLITLERAEGVDYLTQTADWVATHKNGQKTYEVIKKLLSTDPS